MSRITSSSLPLLLLFLLLLVVVVVAGVVVVVVVVINCNFGDVLGAEFYNCHPIHKCHPQKKWFLELGLFGTACSIGGPGWPGGILQLPPCL